MAAWRKGNFATVPNMKIVTKIKGNELNVYLALCQFADDDGGCFPSYETLAQETDSARSSVIKAVKMLTERGLLTKEKRRRDNGSATSNYYQIMDLGVVAPTLLGGSVRDTPITKPLELPVPKGTGANAQNPPKINSLFFKVIKEYRIFVRNHDQIPALVSSLVDSLGESTAELYLTRLLERNVNEEALTLPYVPQITTLQDIGGKSLKIIQHFKKTKGKTGPTSVSMEETLARERANEEEAARIRRGEL